MKSALSIPFAAALGTSAAANDGQGDAPLLWLADEFYEALALYEVAGGDAWDLALDRVNDVAHRLLESPTSSLVGYAAKARAVWWFCDMEMREAGIQFADARDVLISFFRDLEGATGASPGVWTLREPLYEDLATIVQPAPATTSVLLPEASSESLEEHVAEFARNARQIDPSITIVASHIRLDPEDQVINGKVIGISIDRAGQFGTGTGHWPRKASGLSPVHVGIADHQKAMNALVASINAADEMHASYSPTGRRRYERASRLERAAFDAVLSTPAHTLMDRRAKIEYLVDHVERSRFDHLEDQQVAVLLRSLV